MTADAIARTGIEAGAVAWRVRVGEPDGEILAEAKEQGADLLVMGTHGFSGMRRLFFGSTAARVLARTSIPVLTLPPEARQSAHASIESLLPLTRLLVAVDFSESSMTAVREAVALARHWRLALTLLHAIPAGPRLERWTEFLDADHERRIQHARHELQVLAKEFSRERLLAVTVVAEGGSAEEVIARIASEQRGTLVVMGLGQRNLLTPSPGSIAYRVLCITSSAVLVVPTPVASSRPVANARADARL